MNDNRQIYTVALAGNPNVGKSTLFNALTGMKQHTGNWSGKTVSTAEGRCTFGGIPCRIVDIPGTYSLCANSEEEKVARDFIISGGADVVVVVCDATCLERSLILAYQIMALIPRVVVCVNLMDEAVKKGIAVDAEKLSVLLGVPAVPVSARDGGGLEALGTAVLGAARGLGCCPLLEAAREEDQMVKLAERAAAASVSGGEGKSAFDRKLDRILTGRLTGIPIMLALLTVMFYLTIKGMNVPSKWLFEATFYLGDQLRALCVLLGMPGWLLAPLFDGIYRTVAWVVSVMLPPMAVFFPMFTLMEDFGYLPRVAFTLDHAFCRCGTCGKQALTMCVVHIRIFHIYCGKSGRKALFSYASVL